MSGQNDYFGANRAMWNETAAVHERHYLEELIRAFRDPAFSVLDPTEREALDRIGVAGKDVIQLSCNNGRELLSVERLGARRCVGADISDAFIAQALRLRDAANSAAQFLNRNVYELEPELDGRFDLVYVTVGALGWLPEIFDYFRVIARLLRPGGHVLVYEMHPLLDMFEAGQGPVLKHSYFRTHPHVGGSAPDYFQPEETIHATSYWFHHKMSDVVSAAIAAGMEIERFEELPHDLSNVFSALAELDARPPMSYLLVARKRPREAGD
jgi:SAM-dependent methyltransferase